MAPVYFGIFQKHKLGLFIEFLTKFFFMFCFSLPFFHLKFLWRDIGVVIFFVGCSGLGEILLLLDLTNFLK